MRKINERFINDLLFGELSYFLDQVMCKRESLSMEIRDNYVSIYYKGGSLLKIMQNKKGYTFKFDAKYCKNKGDDSNFALLNGLQADDVVAFKTNFHLMMQEMDSWFETHPKPERDYQHRLLVNNPEIIDIEYQVDRRMRLDMLYFADGKLLVVENKYGIGAIGGKAGVSAHYKDICEILQDPKLLVEMLDSVCHISQAKKSLGLTDIVIEKSDIKSVEILFLLANYNPKSQRLNQELARMDGRVPANLLISTVAPEKIEISKIEPSHQCLNVTGLQGGI